MPDDLLFACVERTSLRAHTPWSLACHTHAERHSAAGTVAAHAQVPGFLFYLSNSSAALGLMGSAVLRNWMTYISFRFAFLPFPSLPSPSLYLFFVLSSYARSCRLSRFRVHCIRVAQSRTVMPLSDSALLECSTLPCHSVRSTLPCHSVRARRELPTAAARWFLGMFSRRRC